MRYRNTTTTAAAAVGILTLLVGGCSAESPERADTVQLPAPTSTTPGDDTRDEVLTQQQVESALLTVEDLPTGWSVDRSADSDDSDSQSIIEPAECGELLGRLAEAQDPAADAEASFTAGGFGPFLNQVVAAFEQDTAEQLLRIGDALSQCPEFSSTENGETTTFRAAPLSFPNLGDRTLAVRLDGTTDEVSLTLDIIMIAIGTNAVTLIVAGFVPVDGTELENIAQAAVDKLNNAAT